MGQKIFFDNGGVVGKIANVKTAQYLKYLFDSKDYTMAVVSRDSGVDLPDLSKIVSGKRKCGRASMAKLANVLNDSHKRELLAQWLLDQIPEGMEELVHVTRATTTGRKAGGPVAGSLDADMDAIRSVISDNPAVRKVIRHLAQSYAR